MKKHFGWLMTFKLIFLESFSLVSEKAMFWRSKSENAYENQVYVAQILRKNIIAFQIFFGAWFSTW